MAKPDRSRRPSRRAAAAKAAPKAAPKAKPAARAGKAKPKPAPKTKPKAAAKPKRSALAQDKPNYEGLTPEQIKMRKQQARISAHQQLQLEAKATDRKVQKAANELLRKAEKKELRIAAQMLAEQKLLELRAQGNSSSGHLVGTDKLWDVIGPEAQRQVKTREAAKAKAAAQAKQAQQEMENAQARGLQKMNPQAAAKASKQPKGKRGGAK